MNQISMVERLVAAPPGSPLATAMARRADILVMTQAACEAVLAPREPGGIGHELRRALAARMALLSDAPDIARQYLHANDGTGPVADVADPDATPNTDVRLGAIVRHVDLLTLRPRDATRADIERLRSAGVDDADIVRIAELAAFVGYHVRVIEGLRKLGAGR
jgi:uncharacterized protein YciW